MSSYRGDLSPTEKADLESFTVPTCRICNGLGFLPANHDRGPVPCGCEDDDED